MLKRGLLTVLLLFICLVQFVNSQERSTAPRTESVKVSDFGPFDAFEWRRPIREALPGIVADARRTLKVVSLEDCSLTVEQQIDLSYKPSRAEIIQAGNATAPPVSDKTTIKTSLPLKSLLGDALAIEENNNLLQGPEGKWGVHFSTENKEIDSEALEVSEIGSEPEHSEKITVSVDTFVLVIGTRQQALAFEALVKRAVSQCSQP